MDSVDLFYLATSRIMRVPYYASRIMLGRSEPRAEIVDVLNDETIRQHQRRAAVRRVIGEKVLGDQHC